ncbi:DMT family transporter [Sphingomonas nostoxanthinifaciens]|uniref:DMT family transporter n=1 Tax=Sphingomonas nostoxanthinifaciens TaxID=2872652 RepID=UPI001CC1DB0F|nr:DMT family transporter [Sphingomonas nostoxanthinifaciens]UAK24082.1 DMT family transporter [Sphingomonas nostoxanthinifaciens]
MARLIPILVVLVAGLCLALQPPTNATLARASGSVLLAALISFAVGTLALLVAWMATDRTSPTLLRGVPGWAWFGGFYGAVYVAAFAFAAPRLGLAASITLALTSQVAAALLLDHYGLLGLKTAPITAAKLGGVALVVAGVLLVRRG